MSAAVSPVHERTVTWGTLVNGTWRGADPPALPTFGVEGWLRLVVRASAAFVLTSALFALFLFVRGCDRAAKAMWQGHLPAGAPWVVHLWGRLALPLTGLACAIDGRVMVGPGALVANHASWLDIVVLMRATRVAFVSKSEVRTWPGIGTVARAIGTVFIERRSSEAGRQQDILRTRLARGDRMAIFPEGTSTDGRRVLAFKSSIFGAFQSEELPRGFVVQPVTIVYTASPGLPVSFYGWWGDMSFGSHLAAILALSVGGRVDVIFHAPLPAASGRDRKALARMAELVVRSELEYRVRARSVGAPR